MTLIDGDRIVTAQLYNDEYEEYKEEKMSIIDYVNAYTTEGVTTVDDVFEQIRAEINGIEINGQIDEHTMFIRTGEQVKQMALDIIDKYKTESEEIEQLYTVDTVYEDVVAVDKTDVLQIIDKYRGVKE